MRNRTIEATDKQTVLVVEDNILNRKLFKAILEAGGYAVLEASDGMNGLTLARREHPDTIVMDIQLPGMSGLEVISILKAYPDTACIPILATTGFALPGDEARIMATGCEDYIAKPIGITDFAARVRSLVYGITPSLMGFSERDQRARLTADDR